jgi:hypothetical protein
MPGTVAGILWLLPILGIRPYCSRSIIFEPLNLLWILTASTFL